MISPVRFGTRIPSATPQPTFGSGRHALGGAIAATLLSITAGCGGDDKPKPTINPDSPTAILDLLEKDLTDSNLDQVMPQTEAEQAEDCETTDEALTRTKACTFTINDRKYTGELSGKQVVNLEFFGFDSDKDDDGMKDGSVEIRVSVTIDNIQFILSREFNSSGEPVITLHNYTTSVVTLTPELEQQATAILDLVQEQFTSN